MSDFYFKTGSGQPAFTAETQEGDYALEYRLGAMEPSALVARGRFMQTRSDYARPAANSTVTINGATFYFVDDVDFDNVRGPLLRWTRVWATIPASWTDYEEYAFLYPAISGNLTWPTTAVTVITPSGSNYVLTTSGSSVVTNDSIFIDLQYTRGTVPNYRVTGFTKAIVGGASSITIGNLLAGNGVISSVSGSVGKVTPGRYAQKTYVVGSRIIYDYALTSDASIDTDLPIFQPFVVLDSTSAVTTTVSSTTRPSQSAYAGLMVNGGSLIAECSRRRYLGNIFVRTTRLVPVL